MKTINQRDRYYLSTPGPKDNTFVYYGVLSVFGELIVLSTTKKEETILYYKDDVQGAVNHLKKMGINVNTVLK